MKYRYELPVSGVVFYTADKDELTPADVVTILGCLNVFNGVEFGLPEGFTVAPTGRYDGYCLLCERASEEGALSMLTEAHEAYVEIGFNHWSFPLCYLHASDRGVVNCVVEEMKGY
jgi:hypothetical protein